MKYKLYTNDDLWGPSVKGLPEHVAGIIDDKVMNFIAETPFNSEELSYELTGLWSYNKLKTGGRIIYAICKDCRKKKATIINNCKVCTQMTDDTIMLWIYSEHDIYQELKTIRKKGWKKFVKQKRRDKKR